MCSVSLPDEANKKCSTSVARFRASIFILCSVVTAFKTQCIENKLTISDMDTKSAVHAEDGLLDGVLLPDVDDLIPREPFHIPQIADETLEYLKYVDTARVTSPQQLQQGDEEAPGQLDPEGEHTVTVPVALLQGSSYTCRLCFEEHAVRADILRHAWIAHYREDPGNFDENDWCATVPATALQKRASCSPRVQGQHRNSRSPKKCVWIGCGKSFGTITDLRRHVREVHNKIRSHVCLQCGLSFLQKAHLSTHVMAIHEATDERDMFRCDVTGCTYKNVKKGAVDSHKKTTHLGLAATICPTCGVRIKRGKADLARHNRRFEKCGAAAAKNSEDKKALSSSQGASAQ